MTNIRTHTHTLTIEHLLVSSRDSPKVEYKINSGESSPRRLNVRHSSHGGDTYLHLTFRSFPTDISCSTPSAALLSIRAQRSKKHNVCIYPPAGLVIAANLICRCGHSRERIKDAIFYFPRFLMGTFGSSQRKNRLCS